MDPAAELKLTKQLAKRAVMTTLTCWNSYLKVTSEPVEASSNMQSVDMAKSSR